MTNHNPTEADGEDTARWTADMVAQRAQVSRSTVYDWLRAGRLPPGVEHLADVPYRKRFVVRVSELDHWVKTGKAP